MQSTLEKRMAVEQRLAAQEFQEHVAELEAVNGKNQHDALMASNRGLNDSDYASMPTGWNAPMDTLGRIRSIPGMNHL